MKSVKTFLVGCAAGLVTLTGAQAADLPVKAKPVQYVKICSLYGVGFYYIPGTDMCIKVGGYVRAQAEWQSNNGVGYGNTNTGDFAFSTIPDGRFNRTTNSFNFTGRGVLTVDARNQSEYGTIRGYLRLGGQTLGTAEASTFFVERAFIQFAGFTGGRTQSFFDIFTNTERFTYTDSRTSGDTYNYGVDLMGYTFMFGNGFSASISAEAPHITGVINGANGGAFGAGSTTTATAGFGMPDVVGNLRLDQNWGYVGVSGAVHRVAGLYYGAGTNGTPPLASHPDDKYGWAAQVGGLVNLPWLGPLDSIGASFVYSKGAVGYATKAGSWQILNGNSVGVGWVADGIYDSPTLVSTANTEIHLTNAWSVNAAYEHFWNPRWQTSVYGGYTRVWYDGTITNDINSHLPGAAGSLQCGVRVAGAVWPPITMTNGGAGNSCSPDFSFYQIGSRTQWNITKDFYMGLDVTYTHLNTAYEGVGLSTSGTQFVDNQNVWSGIFRVQRNFVSDNEGPTFVFGR